MTTKLVGTDTTGTDGGGKDYFQLTKFTADATGTLTEIHVYTTANGNVKVAVYADSAGEPGARIVYNNTGQAVTATQWNTLSITPTNIVSGTAYWLAFNMDTNNSVQGKIATGVRRYKTATYSTFNFPDPAGSGFTSNTTSFMCISGYGNAYLEITPTAITQSISVGQPAVTLMLQVITPNAITQSISIPSPRIKGQEWQRIVMLREPLTGHAGDYVVVNDFEDGFTLE